VQNYLHNIIPPAQSVHFLPSEANSSNSASIVEKLAGSTSRRMVQFDLTKLEKLGLIKREGESRSLVWKRIK